MEVKAGNGTFLNEVDSLNNLEDLKLKALRVYRKEEQ